MDLETALSAYDRDGYVILERLLSRAELDELISALAPFEAGRPMGRNNFEGERSQRVYSLAGKGEVFMRLAEHPFVVAMLDRLLLPNWLLSTFQTIRLHPGETAQPWHTDDCFYNIPRPRASLQASAIWAIEDFTNENGATELIPGSHRWGPELPEERPDAPAVKTIMPAGSVVVFNGATWHRGGANQSNSTRLAISPQYCQPWLRPQESMLLIAPPSIAAAYSERGRAMLGYSIHPPFIGQVEGMHPLRLIDPEYRSRKTQDHEIADQLLERPPSVM